MKKDKQNKQHKLGKKKQPKRNRSVDEFLERLKKHPEWCLKTDRRSE
jgi:hypothetical protein